MLSNSRKIAVCAAAAALLGLVLPAGASAGDRLLAPMSACKGQASSAAPVAKQVRAMVCLHRYARRKAGRRATRVSRKLRRSANLKAGDLLNCGQFNHDPCGIGDAFARHAEVGYMKGSYGVGENLAYGEGPSGSPRAMMSAWLRSPAHRPVLLSKDFDEIGIALLPGDPEADLTPGAYDGAAPQGRIWVAHFGYQD